VILEFDDPREVVTVTLEAAGGGSTDLAYSLLELETPADHDAAQRGGRTCSTESRQASIKG
jgi:hypothetical protein